MAIEDLKTHMNLAHLLFNIAKKYISDYRQNSIAKNIFLAISGQPKKGW